LETVLTKEVFFREMHKSTCHLFFWHNEESKVTKGRKKKKKKKDIITTFGVG
jgi:hypothetical protein